MKFPEEFIKKGDFTLHSGKKTDIFYDVNALLTNRHYFEIIINSVPIGNLTYVGIATGGAIIAGHFTPFAMIKDAELNGVVEGEYCLVDDVCTTERSLREAIQIIGRNPKCIFVVVDRRRTKNLNLESLFDIGDIE